MHKQLVRARRFIAAIGQHPHQLQNHHKKLSQRTVVGDMTENSGENSSPLASKTTTVGLIIIGDEILNGQVMDSNTHFICNKLYSFGVKVKRVSVIRDTIEEIADEVREFSDKYDVVLTTGGIGPTHDDLTYRGLAKAFNDDVELNPTMAKLLRKTFRRYAHSEEVLMKMAEMPASATLIFDPSDVNSNSSFPIVVVRNVYVFPGVPKFLQVIFPRMKDVIKHLGSKFYFKEVFLNKEELGITPELNQIVNEFKGAVSFGSYPVVDNLYFSTRITMESINENHIKEAERSFIALLPENSVVHYDNQPLTSAAQKVYSILEDSSNPLHIPVRSAITILEEGLTTYEVENICICFNGGKDCTALLHLFYAVVQKLKPQKLGQLNALCVQNSNSFSQVDTFIKETSARYNLNSWTYDEPIKAGLTYALAEHPEMKAVLIGTRRTDPSGQNLRHFQMTDESWPQVMRISPLLDWSYQEVWKFLRSLSLPYCALYNQGYTSIGSKSNSFPNPALLIKEEGGKEKYRPAYELVNSLSERAGRK